jgi:hypothetical protein
MFINTKQHAEIEFPNTKINIIVGLVTDTDAESYTPLKISILQQSKTADEIFNGVHICK